MPYAIAITGLLLFAHAIDEASKDAPHYGWSMASITCFIAAGGMY